jgi:hypothetical protein
MLASTPQIIGLIKPSGSAGEYAVLIFRIRATRAPRAIRHHIVAMNPVEGLPVHSDHRAALARSIPSSALAIAFAGC